MRTQPLKIPQHLMRAGESCPPGPSPAAATQAVDVSQLGPVFDPARSLITLRVLDGMLRDTILVLRPGQNVVGRDRFCEQQLMHPTISRVHCMVEVWNGRVMVHDMGSLHGVFVNGRSVFSHALVPRDLVRLGDVDLVVESRLQFHVRPRPRVERRASEALNGLATEPCGVSDADRKAAIDRPTQPVQREMPSPPAVKKGASPRSDTTVIGPLPLVAA